MSVYGPNELQQDVHEQDLCIGCGACVALCPYFKNYKGKTSMVFDCTLTEGRCFAHCPKTEVDLNALALHFWKTPYEGRPLGSYQTILAARAGKNMVSGQFQGGGTVSALITLALKNGIVDVAALTDRKGVDPQPRLVKEWREVVECAGAKFMASPTLAGLNAAVAQGHANVGVVGTPCQMLAVAQMRTNPLDMAQFQDPVGLAIGLFCNWALDAREIETLLSGRMAPAEIRSMDIPPPPADVMIVRTAQAEHKIPLSEVKPLIPHTCYICLDMTAEFADVSVGMYEGRPGWNTLIVRSERGASLVKTALKEDFLETEDMPTEVIEHLSRAAAAKKDRSVRTLMRRELLNRDGKDERCALRMPAAVARYLIGAGEGS